MSSPGEDLERRALLAQLRRVSELAAGMDPADLQPPWSDLVIALRRVPELLDELDASGKRGERLEKQCDELIDRLIVTESALQSTSEARDDAILVLAEIREIATGQADGSPVRDVVQDVRRLREAAVTPRNPPDSDRGRSHNR